MSMMNTITEEEVQELFHCDSCDTDRPDEGSRAVITRHGWRTVRTYVCSCCVEENSDRYRTCDGCGDLYDRYYAEAFSDGETFVCRDCGNDYCECNSCGCVTRTDDAYWSDYHDCWYCDSCGLPVSSADNSYINDYSHKPQSIFHRDNGEVRNPNNEYLGVELEIDGDSGSDLDSCSYDLYQLSQGEELFYMKHDGSLCGRYNDSDIGIEIVTHPATLSYHLNQMPWNKICDIANANGYDYTDSCGLHVHVSRASLGADANERDLTIAKMYILLDRFWDKFAILSRRSSFGWCSPVKPNVGLMDSNETAVNKMKDASHGRYRCINLNNWNTVEFRLWAGTTDPHVIRSTLMLTHFLCQFAKSNKLSRCVRIPWKKFRSLVEFEELKQYFDEMGV